MTITVNTGTPDASPIPDGWELEYTDEGGQPNGSGELEASDAREWFSPARETHHRRVITLYGPWEDGPTPWALQIQENTRRAQAAETLRREERTLREAQEILARRAQRETHGDADRPQ